MPKQFTYERIVKECEELGVKFNESKEEYLKARSETKNRHFQYICFIAKCGHPMKCQYNSINKNNTEKCYGCRGVIARTDFSYFTYENVKNVCDKKGVELIDKVEDIKKEEERGKKRSKETGINNKQYRINIIAKCGHSKNIHWSAFNSTTNNYEEIHLKCKKCVNEYIKSIRSGTGNKTMKQEESSVNYLCSLLTGFESFVNCEGCQADIIIRPKSSIDNKWVKVQCKSTQLDTNMFKTHKNTYPDNIILFHNVKTNKIWVMPPNILTPLTGVHMSDSTKSKYYKYKIDDHERLNETFMTIYDRSEKFDKETIMCPISKKVQLEYEYRSLRENSIKYFDFKTLYSENTDFMVNDKRFQEKTRNRNPTCRDSYPFHLKCNKGRYNQGDNDFYWFNLAGTNIFYVIPEQKLLDGDVVRRTITLHSEEGEKHVSYKDNWTSEYKFNYDTINEEGERNRLVSMIESI